MQRKRGLVMACLLMLISPSVFIQHGLNNSPIVASASAPGNLGDATFTGALAARGKQDVCDWTTCPEPKSCSGWSNYYNCDSPFCEQDDPSCIYNPDATYQMKERFRACTLEDNTSCLEFEHYAQRLYCGCRGTLSSSKDRPVVGGGREVFRSKN
jgi:hypothetical protein